MAAAGALTSGTPVVVAFDIEGPQLEPEFQDLRYRDEIDGLRALAVVGVVLYHYDLGLPGGFAGVDVFFVISGFLITALVLADLQHGHFSLKAFWLRRLRRLFPAFAAMLAAVISIAPFFLFATAYRNALVGSVLSLLMGINVQLYLQSGGYFNHPINQPLLHCWSLSVEEQFYVFYPVVLKLLTFGLVPSKHRMVLGLLLVFAFSLATSTLVQDKDFVFYMLPARAWELCLGALLALWEGTERWPRWAAELSAWAGVVLMLATFVFFDRHGRWPGLSTLVPCGGAALFIGGRHVQRTSVGILFGHWSVAFVGRLSYSVYLWHWPIFVCLSVLAGGEHLQVSEALTGLGLTFLAASVSYFAVESTTRRDTKFSNMIFLRGAVVVWVSLMVVCLMAVVILKPSLEPELPRPSQMGQCGWISGNSTLGVTATCWNPCNQTEIDTAFDLEKIVANRALMEKAMGQEGLWRRWQYFTTPIVGKVFPQGATEKPTVAFVGSCHVAMYGALIERLAKESGQDWLHCIERPPGHLAQSAHQR